MHRILTLAIVALAAAGTLRTTLGAEQPPPPPTETSTQPPPATPAEPPADQGTKTVWDGVFTEEQSKRGAAVYAQDCGNCHGAALEGMDMSPALTGPAFTANWNTLTVGDLFERTRISMPQDKPGRLTRQQYADVIAFLLSANKWPAGNTELPVQVPYLKMIRIDAIKP